MKNPGNALPTRVKHQWIRFFARHKEVKSVTLFGSRARGDANEKADIDVSISAPTASQRQWLEIALFLKEKTNSLLPVDVIRWEGSSPTLRGKIREEGLVLYEKPCTNESGSITRK